MGRGPRSWLVAACLLIAAPSTLPGCTSDDVSSVEAEASTSGGSTAETWTSFTVGTSSDGWPTDCSAAVELDGDLIVGEERAPGPPVWRVAGSVEVDGTIDRVDLEDLDCLREVEGSLSVSNNFSLVDIAGLRNLERVRGSFEIDGNEALPEIGPFSQLAEVGGLSLSSNPRLASFQLGTLDLATKDGRTEIRVSNNDRLKSFALELGSIRTPPDADLIWITVSNNDAVTDFRFDVGSVATEEPAVPVLVEVRGNDMLQDFVLRPDAFPPDTTFTLRFEGNEELRSLDLEAFAGRRISKLEVIDAPSLTKLKFGGSEIGYLGIRQAPALANLTGFSQLQTADRLVLEPGSGLTDLRDLSNLREVRTLGLGHCSGRATGGLRTLDGLGALAGLQTLVVAANPELRDLTGLRPSGEALGSSTVAIQANPQLRGEAVEEFLSEFEIEFAANYTCGNQGEEPCREPLSGCLFLG